MSPPTTNVATTAATSAAPHATTTAATNAAPHATTTAAPNAAPHATTTAATNVAPHATTNVAPDAATTAATNVAPDAATTTATSAAPHAATTAAPNVAPDATTNVAPDAATTAATNVGPDATTTAATSVARDAATAAINAVTGEPSLADQQRDVARSRIIRATREVLARRGLSATVDDVAEAAEISRRTVFRYFATREKLFAAAIRDALRSYGEHLPPTTGVDLDGWLLDLLLVAHRLNAHHGRMYWELSALEPELTGELADAAAERREGRMRFSGRVSQSMWRARGGPGTPPTWLADTVAVHLSGFTTQSLAGDFGRTSDEVARVSQRVLLASLDAALDANAANA